ncbi:uncharacterized protein NMK_1751 [Novimethylophilus kurashikiensis]|uniref:Uncharacterized protein n=1 Tax=Novimethylophilus kurashikiensis TaxID=1825523 RepID=A0A2R5F7M0_9PROT|nr:uncharacterized protein NMK_1751 [Novimethylophilus kurashikiensis]
MQGATCNEWLFHSQAVQRRTCPFVFKPYGLALHCTHGGVARRLFGMTKHRSSRLALRAMQDQRTFVSY